MSTEFKKATKELQKAAKQFNKALGKPRLSVKVTTAAKANKTLEKKTLKQVARPELIKPLEKQVSELVPEVRRLLCVVQQERWERQQAELKASLTINQPNYVQRVWAAVRGF